MHTSKRVSRRQLLKGAAVAGTGAILAACQPKVVEVEKVITQVVKEVVKETVMVAGTPQTVEKVVEKVVTKVVEKVVTSTPVTMKDVTVTYWDWWGLTSGATGQMFEWFQQRYAETAPHVKMDLQVVPWDEYFRKFLTAQAAGDPPDCLQVSVDWGRDFWDAGVLTDLVPYMELTSDVTLDDFMPVALPQMAKGPVQYGLPYVGPDYDCFFLNCEHFEEAGIPCDKDVLAEEWTWDDFTAAANELTIREGDEIKRSGFLVGVPNMDGITDFCSTQGVDFFKPQEKGVAFNDNNALVNGLNWWLDLLYKTKVSQPLGPERQDWNQFIQGTTSMVRSGPWRHARVNAENPGMVWTSILYPKHPGPNGKYSTCAWTNALALPNGSKVADEAFDLMHFICGPEAAMKKFAFGKWASPLKSFWDTPEYKMAEGMLPVLKNIPLAGDVGAVGPFIMISALNAVCEAPLQAVMLQEREPEEAVEEMVKAANEVMAEAGYK